MFVTAKLKEEATLISQVFVRFDTMDITTVSHSFEVLDKIHEDHSINNIRVDLAEMKTYWEASQNLRDHAEAFHVWHKLCRQRVMIAEVYIPFMIRGRAYEWSKKLLWALSSSVNGSLGDDWDDGDADDWLNRLVKDVFNRCSLRKEFTIRASSYLDDHDHDNYTGYLRSCPDNSDAYIGKVADIVCDILSSWFNLPSLTDTTRCVRAYFIHVLLTYIGPSALLFDEVWDVYEAAPTWLLNDRQRKRSGKHEVKFSPQMMSDFADNLKGLRAAKSGTTEYKLLRAMKTGYRAFLLKSKVSPVILGYTFSNCY